MTENTPVRSKETPVAVTESPFGWLRQEIDRLFEDFGRPARGLAAIGSAFGPVPAVELVDDEKEYRLTAELPGMKEDDVEVSFAEGVLTLKGEKREETERRDAGFMLSERRYGAFERRVRLPGDVDPDKIDARFTKGVLTVTVGKDEKAPKARKIAVTPE